MPVGKKGRTELTECDREILKSIRQAETLRWKAYEKRDGLIKDALERGIAVEIIAGAAGFATNPAGRHQVNKVARNPYTFGSRKMGRKRKAPPNVQEPS